MYKSIFNSMRHPGKSRFLALVTLAIFFLAACRKEYQLPPVGQPIPYKDTIPDLTAYISADKAHSTFWSLWQRSGILKRLDSLHLGLDSARLTIFAPGNDVLGAAGWDAARVTNAPQATVDSLVFFHTYRQQILPVTLVDNSNNYLTSLFTGTGTTIFKITGGTGYMEDNSVPNYPWRIFLGAQQGDLLINRKVVGKLADARVAKNVTIFNIGKVLQKPLFSTREWLVRDGRFSLFLAIRRYNDSVYNSLCGQTNSYVDLPWESHQFAAASWGIGYAGAQVFYPALDYLANEQHYYDPNDQTMHTKHNLVMHTLLAPTDEAFHQAGFNTLNDLITFDQRTPLYPVPSDDWWSNYSFCSGYFPIDSVLCLHLYGLNPYPTYGPLTDDGLNAGGGGLMPATSILYYSNLFRSGFLNGPGSTVAGPDNRVTNPFDYFTSGNTVRVRAKGSNYEAATITDPDIETYNGIIHVVDRLLVPPGFKLHN